jgi:hypothetical protein
LRIAKAMIVLSLRAKKKGHRGTRQPLRFEEEKSQRA